MCFAASAKDVHADTTRHACRKEHTANSTQSRSVKDLDGDAVDTYSALAFGRFPGFRLLGRLPPGDKQHHRVQQRSGLQRYTVSTYFAAQYASQTDHGSSRKSSPNEAAVMVM